MLLFACVYAVDVVLWKYVDKALVLWKYVDRDNCGRINFGFILMRPDLNRVYWCNTREPCQIVYFVMLIAVHDYVLITYVGRRTCHNATGLVYHRTVELSYGSVSNVNYF